MPAVAEGEGKLEAVGLVLVVMEGVGTGVSEGQTVVGEFPMGTCCTCMVKPVGRVVFKNL